MTIGSLLRAVAFGLSLIAVPALAENGVTESSIVLDQTAALSGPFGELGRDMLNGTKAYVEHVNASGGVHGRKISIIGLDDQFKAEVASANMDRLIRQDKVFALLGVTGTPTSLEAIRQTAPEGVPLFAPASGAQSVREPMHKNVFVVRASARDEILKILTHARTIGLHRLAVVYSEASFSGELQYLTQEMDKTSWKPVVVSAVRPDGSGTAELVASVGKPKPEAVLLLTLGKTTVDFIKAYNATAHGTQFYTLSNMGANSVVQALGTDGVGVIVTSVVPFPWSAGTPIVKEYQDAMRAIGIQEFSFVSLEGYINTRVFIEALRRAGKEPTRAKLVAAAESLRPLRLGGFDLSYSPQDHTGSHFVDLNIISAGGRFRK